MTVCAPPKRKLLVVDDERDMAEMLEYKLRQEAYEVRLLCNPLSIVSTTREFQPDLILLDVMMPELSGLQVCRMLRADPMMKDIPIIFLTARGSSEDRIEGLESGADDYLSKPFETRELLLRIKAVLARVKQHDKAPEASETLSIGEVTINIHKHQLYCHGKPIELTATEFKLLRLLMERKGRVQTRENLLINVWNYEADIETRTVDTHIRRLREKLGPAAGLIETVRGVGYRAVEA